MRAPTAILYLVAILAGAQASFLVRSVPAEEHEDMVVTWTKPGRHFRAHEVTVKPQVTTATEITVTIPPATFALRSVESTIRKTKRAILNGWSLQGCADDDDKIPPMVSPFPYQLSADNTSVLAACTTAISAETHWQPLRMGMSAGVVSSGKLLTTSIRVLAIFLAPASLVRCVGGGTS